jgi:hypothetical protein
VPLPACPAVARLGKPTVAPCAVRPLCGAHLTVLGKSTPCPCSRPDLGDRESRKCGEGSAEMGILGHAKRAGNTKRPKGAQYESPGQRPGLGCDSFPVALKGRNTRRIHNGYRALSGLGSHVPPDAPGRCPGLSNNALSGLASSTRASIHQASPRRATGSGRHQQNGLTARAATKWPVKKLVGNAPSFSMTVRQRR